MGPKFFPLYLDSIFCAVFFSAGFDTNAACSSQLSFITVMMDNRQRANTVYYGSLISKRITRSIMAAELFTIVHGFDVSSTIRLAINAIHNQNVLLTLYTDTKAYSIACQKFCKLLKSDCSLTSLCLSSLMHDVKY